MYILDVPDFPEYVWSVEPGPGELPSNGRPPETDQLGILCDGGRESHHSHPLRHSAASTFEPTIPHEEWNRLDIKKINRVHRSYLPVSSQRMEGRWEGKVQLTCAMMPILMQVVALFVAL